MQNQNKEQVTKEKTAIPSALIGAFALIFAAIIAGLFSLSVKNGGDASDPKVTIISIQSTLIANSDEKAKLASTIAAGSSKDAQNAQATLEAIQKDREKLEQKLTSVVTQQPSQNTKVNEQGLTINEAISWCSGSYCNASRFSQLQESNGYLNPNGVAFSSGGCVIFTIPTGVRADIWDGTKATMGIPGPIKLNQVCQASFRR